MAGRAGQPRLELTKSAAYCLSMNSWSAACWPRRTATFPPSNDCSYQSSKRRVERGASMPLARFRLSRFFALSPWPWIWEALGVEGAAGEPEQLLRIDRDAHQRRALVGRTLIDAAGNIAQDLAGFLQGEI